MYKNIMLKISGESLAGSNEQGFDFDILNDLSNSIKILQTKNLKSLSYWVGVTLLEVLHFQTVLSIELPQIIWEC